MCCSSVHRASAKPIWPRPLVTRPSVRTFWCSTVPSSIWSGTSLKDEAFNQQDKTLRKYLKPDLVIIDDMGLKQLPDTPAGLLEVIMRRYENRSTIMTSNRPLEEWGKLLCDVPTAGAMSDRFLHYAGVAITGKSYRVKEAPVLPQENKKSRKSNEPLAAGAAG